MDPITEAWREHRTRVRRYIAGRVADSEAVEDILQDVFLKAHANLSSLRARGSMASWLYRIASNAIVDHYRARQPMEELPDEVEAPAPERDHVAELAGCLEPMIAALPARYRAALVLSEIEGVPQREVATQLGISLSGAKSRVQRGRRLLRRSLLECCEVETGRRGIVGYEPRRRDCRCS